MLRRRLNLLQLEPLVLALPRYTPFQPDAGAGHRAQYHL